MPLLPAVCHLETRLLESLVDQPADPVFQAAHDLGSHPLGGEPPLPQDLQEAKADLLNEVPVIDLTPALSGQFVDGRDGRPEQGQEEKDGRAVPTLSTACLYQKGENLILGEVFAVQGVEEGDQPRGIGEGCEQRAFPP